MGEWLINNWFFILALIGNLIMYGYFAGRAKQNFENLEVKVDKGFEEMKQQMEASSSTFDEHEKNYNEHVGNADIHVNKDLRALFDTRFENIEKGVDRIQRTLDKM